MAKKKDVEVEAKSVDELLAEAGVDVADAKLRLQRLRAAFAVGVGGIPDAALRAWANECFSGSAVPFWAALGRSWEKGE